MDEDIMLCMFRYTKIKCFLQSLKR
jgi:hypothetical protein